MTAPYDAVDVHAVPLPPVGAERITTACNYCIVACGYIAWRWPVGMSGGPRADQNALGVDFPNLAPTTPWVSPNQHNIVTHEGRPHHVVVVPDFEADVVNLQGNHSIRGGTLAQKLYNPETLTRERLKEPMIRVVDTLTPVSWDLVTDVMAAVSKHVLDRYGVHGWGMKTYSYDFFENTYAISKLTNVAIGTPIYAPHDKPQAAEDTPGLDDAGINAFSASYEDWGACDVAFCSGVDPYETKTVLFHVVDDVRRQPEQAHDHGHAAPDHGRPIRDRERGGCGCPSSPARTPRCTSPLARIVIENGWQDQAFIDQWVASRWEVNSGYGRGTRNTRWQWRTTWGRFQSDWDDYREWIMQEPAAELARASEITGLNPSLIERAAEMIAKPREDGTRPKTSLHAGEGQLLVQQLHEHRVRGDPGPDLRRGQPPRAGDLARRRGTSAAGWGRARSAATSLPRSIRAGARSPSTSIAG